MTPRIRSALGFSLLLLAGVLNAPALAAQDSPDDAPADAASSARTFRFRHAEGDILHADALVRESVILNGVHTHDAEISESSLSRVLSVDADGSALLRAEFRTDEWILGTPSYREWVSTETVELRRSPLGLLTVPESAGRPVLRDIPVFPESPVSPGHTWTAPAEEVHHFRIGGRLYGPYRGTFPVSYAYEGDMVSEGIRLARIRIEYAMHIPVRRPGDPVRALSGRSAQILLWDLEAGRPRSKTEEFEFLMVTSDGVSQEFIGTQEVDYRAMRPLDRDRIAGDLRDRLASSGTVAVEAAEEGVRLILRDEAAGRILFAPESARIAPDQRELLDALARALGPYRERDILVTGHTADFGTAEGRRRLSTERAAAVAEALFPDGRPGPGKLYIRGAGAREPVGSDAENRRVEILILD